uniref:2Fe-2S ferredoxin-type domain-containing protein n=1 Tax=Malurus cyaneus samueli TaxID=2593467 RepID=A0A8C5TC82_9PASS
VPNSGPDEILQAVKITSNFSQVRITSAQRKLLSPVALQAGADAMSPALSQNALVGVQKRLNSSDFANLSYSSEDQVTVHFINRDGEKLTTTAKEGQSLLEVVVNQNLAIDGFGACEGTLACSTCHLIFDKEAFQKLDAISDEELDMLDLAYGLTDTSRLGCQVHVKKSMDGVTVRVPMDVSDMRRQLEVGKQSKQ